MPSVFFMKKESNHLECNTFNGIYDILRVCNSCGLESVHAGYTLFGSNYENYEMKLKMTRQVDDAITSVLDRWLRY